MERENYKNPKRVLKILIFISIFCNIHTVSSSQYPNIVLIIADDISTDFSCYSGQVYTPNIDQLAKSGVLFENAYVTASSCSPSRASIITGRYPHNTGAPELHMELPEGQFVFPQALKKVGYYCMQAGKWHLGEAARSSFDILYDLPYEKDPTGSENWVRCLKERPKDKPFFMWFASFDAHRPWEPDLLAAPFDPDKVIVPAGVPNTQKARQDMACYYDEVKRFDRYVGYVIDELKRQHVYENTLVVLLSDNGRPFPRNKTSLYDNGMRIPLIIHWPNQDFVKGAVSKSLVSTIDIAPTILSAANLPVPSQIQGSSLLSACDQTDVEIHEAIYGERNWHVQRACGRMVRRGNYVYIKDLTPEYYSFQMVDYDVGSYAELLRLKADDKLTLIEAEAFSTERSEEMLFNVVADPQQLVNLAKNPKYNKELMELRSLLADWQRRTGDSLPKIEEMTPDRHDRVTYKRLYSGLRPPTGIIPGEKAGAAILF